MLVTANDKAAGYNGLTELTEGLPRSVFRSASLQRELQRIGTGNWIYVCRSSEFAGQARLSHVRSRRSENPVGSQR